MKRRTSWLWCLVVAAAALPTVSCSREPAIGPPDQIYTVRGVIASLPVPDRPARELAIRHEPIPAFVNRDGKTVGMDSMEMPFTPAPGVSLNGLAVGQTVEFTFEVRWKRSPFSRLTRIQPLAPQTPLDLGKIKPQP